MFSIWRKYVVDKGGSRPSCRTVALRKFFVDRPETKNFRRATIGPLASPSPFSFFVFVFCLFVWNMIFVLFCLEYVFLNVDSMTHIYFNLSQHRRLHYLFFSLHSIQKHKVFSTRSTTVKWLKYCRRYGVKPYPINSSINQSTRSIKSWDFIKQALYIHNFMTLML